MTLNNTNFPFINNAFTQGPGTSSTNSFVPYFSTRDPTTADVNYPITKRWINFSGPKEWILQNYSESNNTTTANWIQLSSGAGLTLSVTVPLGTSPVSPSILGVLNFTSSDSSVSITGSTNTIDFKATTAALSGLTPDIFTMPGTSPVLPAGGNIKITGSFVGANGHPVRTDSLLANTMEIEVQAASAQATTGSTAPGLASFSNTQFSVDTNGFVTLAGGSGAPTLGLIPDIFTGPGTSPVTPSSGNITITGSVVGAGTHPVRTDSLAAHTMEIEVQTSQAIAATDATKIGLAAFNSANFSVDANGFVTLTSIAPIGTVVQSAVTNIAMTANVAKTITSISLTAGTWAISTIFVGFAAGGSQAGQWVRSGISTVSNTFQGNDGDQYGYMNYAGMNGFSTISQPVVIPNFIVTPAVTTTYYLIGYNIDDNTSILTGNGRITAIRLA